MFTENKKTAWKEIHILITRLTSYISYDKRDTL